MATTVTVPRRLFSISWILCDAAADNNRELLNYQSSSHSGTENMQNLPLSSEDNIQGGNGYNHDSDPQSILFIVFMAVLLFAWCLCLFSG